jgi:hypothetical protein
MNHRNQIKLALVLFVACTLAGSWAVYQAYETFLFAKAARLELAK